MVKIDENNKILILDEHDLKKTLEYLKFKGGIRLNMKKDKMSPIVPIEQIKFVRKRGGLDG